MVTLNRVADCEPGSLLNGSVRLVTGVLSTQPYSFSILVKHCLGAGSFYLYLFWLMNSVEL